MTLVYDIMGNLAAEYSNSAPAVSGTTYISVDHLGSTRLVTSAANTMMNGQSPGPVGTAPECRDYLPFGGVLTRNDQCASTDTGIPELFTGKEQDAETGLDYFGVRYFSAAQGRFTSPDPSRLSAFFDSPQSWNMYTYAYNNPLQFVDKTGRWPTSIHNKIIEQAFKVTLTPDQIQILKDVSAQQDSILGGGQANALSFQHAMRAHGQSVAEAEPDYQDFVSMNEDSATKAQVSFWIAGNPGFSNDALKKFAAALHAVLDGFPGVQRQWKQSVAMSRFGTSLMMTRLLHHVKK